MIGLLLLVPNLLDSKPLAKADIDAIKAVDELYPSSYRIVAAICTHESGARFHECGHLSGWSKRYRQTRVALYYRKSVRNYIECGRSVTKALYKFAFVQEPRPEIFDFLAVEYHNGSAATNAAWAKSVRSIYHALPGARESRKR